ncbi:iron ABC transporter permease [Alkalibaculum bacchi]|uniref:FecCD family ABC transporter permease n=1 Tax=Alkalibaculum bacchi TaxID=645887 RepID=UPI0026EA6B6E|nr:iron ABC transporter permease [Alkalibaculum bacchi]
MVVEQKQTNILAYEKYKTRSIFFLCFLALALILSALLALRAGSYETSLVEIAKAIFGKADAKMNTVVQNMRLPRVITAILGGCGLGITGCVLQAVLHNPMASASTLGISQGATFGASFAIIVLSAGTQGNTGINFSNSLLISLCAFICSMGVSALVLGLSRIKKITPESMILVGVALSAMFQGGATLLQYFASEEQLTSVVFWTFGDLGRTGWKEIYIMAVVVLLACLFFMLKRWDYNALESGEQTAISLGVNVNRERIVNMIICSLTASVIVSYVGLINFIGLIAPHIVRRFIGNNHVYLLPCSALMGGVLLLLGDLGARGIMSPVILPIGAITSFLGAPLFIYLIFKGGNKK